MAEISGNPVGSVNEEAIKQFVQSLADKWKEENPTPAKWWQFWKSPKFIAKAAQFMLDAVDAMVVYVDKLIENGPDKKATVIAALAALYDVVVADLLPIWLRPFASGVKQLLVYVVMSLMIDFIVNKYRSGSWSKGEENAKTEDPKQV